MFDQGNVTSYKLLKNKNPFLQMTVVIEKNYLKRDMYMISNTDILLCLIVGIEFDFVFMTYSQFKIFDLNII